MFAKTETAPAPMLARWPISVRKFHHGAAGRLVAVRKNRLRIPTDSIRRGEASEQEPAVGARTYFQGRIVMACADTDTAFLN
jgi:hypothetical protein